MLIVTGMVTVMVTVMEPRALSQVGWLATSTSMLNFLQTYSFLLAKASTNSDFNWRKDCSGYATPAKARLSQARR